MKKLIFIIIKSIGLVMILAAAFYLLKLAVQKNGATRQLKWMVVTNSVGQIGFVNWQGKVQLSDYPNGPVFKSCHEALISRDFDKKFSEDWDAGRIKHTDETQIPVEGFKPAECQ